MNLYLNHIINEMLYSFNESIQYEYNVPDDIKKQFFDFYIWSYAYQNINSADFYILGTSSAYDLDNIIREAIEKIVIVQKELLLEAGFYSILSELQYPVLKGWKGVVDYSTSKIIYRDDEDRRNKMQAKVNKRTQEHHSQKFIKFLQKNISNFKEIETLVKNVQGMKNISGITQEDKIKVIDLLLSRKKTSKKQIVENAIKIFSYKDNTGLYGGPAWIKICNAWLELYNARSISETIKEIDDMYDMQHNTGFALNKDQRFNSKWIQESLDLKFRADIWNLQEYSSIPERIVGFISKVLGQSSKESSIVKSVADLKNNIENLLKKFNIKINNIVKSKNDNFDLKLIFYTTLTKSISIEFIFMINKIDIYVNSRTMEASSILINNNKFLNGAALNPTDNKEIDFFIYNTINIIIDILIRNSDFNSLQDLFKNNLINKDNYELILYNIKLSLHNEDIKKASNLFDILDKDCLIRYGYVEIMFKESISEKNYYNFTFLLDKGFKPNTNNLELIKSYNYNSLVYNKFKSILLKYNIKLDQ